jgi:hypothetical protein
MASLVEALDHYTPKQIGEKGHLEFGWSNDIHERITQFSFQLTRTSHIHVYKNLAFQLTQLLDDLKTKYSNGQGKLLKNEYIEYMSVLYRMIGNTRDIIDGKGEYTLSYMLLDVWYKMYPELAKFALKYFVTNENSSIHPYGSWKDVKYLYKYSKANNHCLHDLVLYGVELMNDQLRLDSVSENPSLVAKWVVREKSQFSDLFDIMASHYFSSYLETAKTEVSKTRALLKAKMDYRKLISSINRILDTTQIKQCANKWSEIVPENLTSITMMRQKKAFLNLKKNGECRSELEDRKICAEHFIEFANKASRNECSIKGKRIGLNEFTMNALNIISNSTMDSPEAKILNAQWIDNSTQTNALGKMIAMVDVSGSMHGTPLNTAIALGIRVAEKSMLGKRILTFSASPTWVNLDSCQNFIEMVEKVNACNWGMNTNFYAALNLILNSIISNKLKPEDVEDMVLTIFSDMQIDESHDKTTGRMETMMAEIELLYADAGQKLWNKPFKPPHILFWNLRSTNGFPTLSLQKNTSMMSGFSPSLLNVFCDEGLSALQQYTPWSLLTKTLNNVRYNVLDVKIRETFM